MQRLRTLRPGRRSATLTSNGVNDMIKAGLKDAGKNAVELFFKMMCTAPADSTVVEPKAEEE